MPSTEWLTAQQAADLLQVHIGTLRRWSNDGYLPHRLTAGGQRRFDRAALEAWLDEQERPAHA
jgi:excisionase family DNA binding protein